MLFDFFKKLSILIFYYEDRWEVFKGSVGVLKIDRIRVL